MMLTHSFTHLLIHSYNTPSRPLSNITVPHTHIFIHMAKTCHSQIKKVRLERLTKWPWSAKIAMSDLEVESSSLNSWQSSYATEYLVR